MRVFLFLAFSTTTERVYRYNPHTMSTRLQVTTNPAEDTPQPVRNEPCPCGTGIKYKNCCGMLDLAIPGRPDALDLEPEFIAAQEVLNNNY